MTHRAATPTQNPPDHAAYAQSSKLGALSRAYASTLSGPSLSRSEFDALHSPQPLTPVAPARNAFDPLSLEGQFPTGARMNRGSFAGLPVSTMDSHFFSQPDVRYHQSQASPFSTLPPGADQHSAAFSTPSLLVPFPSLTHSGLLPTAFPYHRSAQATMTSQPGFKTLDRQPPQVSVTQRETMPMSHSSLNLSLHSPSHYSQPVLRSDLTSEPSRKLPNRAITEMGYVMWIGNLESSASLDELYTFFRQIDPVPLPPVQSAVVSIMYMPSTNCALVNMRNEATLKEAVERFHGARLRPNTKSARLVCRRRGGELGSESSLMKPPEPGPSRWVTYGRHDSMTCSRKSFVQFIPTEIDTYHRNTKRITLLCAQVHRSCQCRPNPWEWAEVR